MSSELPSEIVFEILILLSVKHLLRFRCVSKSWRAMIDSPFFINGHVKRSIETTTNHHLIVDKWELRTRERPPSNLLSASIDEGLGISLKGMSKPRMYQTRRLYPSSCNGLIFMHDYYEAVALWNPFTRRCRKIPTEPFETPNIESWPDYPSTFGFGYDDVHDDYKIVRIMGFYHTDSLRAHEVKVYSLGTNTWRRVQDFPYIGYTFWPSYGAFASGASHWLLYALTSDNVYYKYKLLIAAFDYVKEEFQVLPQPEYTEVFDYNCLVALQGCLCMLSFTYVQGATHHVTMYMMKHYGTRGSWSKTHILTQANLTSCFRHARPLMYSMRGDKLLVDVNFYDIIDKVRSGLVWYDLQEKKGSKMEICDEAPKLFEVLVCLESLVRLGEDDHFDGELVKSASN